VATKEQLLEEVQELKETSIKEVQPAAEEKPKKPIELESVLEGVRGHIDTLRRLAEESA
jgi:hypothetical protein